MARGYPDFEGGKVGLYSIAEWAARGGFDKDMYNYAENVALGGGGYIDYDVPAGKTLFISSLCVSSFAHNGADADKNQMCEAFINDITTGLVWGRAGGNGGVVVTYIKPIALAAEHHIHFYIINRANHNCDIYLSIQGYEV